MPLASGYTSNHSMKSGTTITSGALDEWDDGMNTPYIPASGAVAPRTDLATLNGVPVLSFNGSDQALSSNGFSFDRSAVYRLRHFVIRGYDNGSFNYVEDRLGGTVGNSSAVLHSSTSWQIRTATNSTSVASKNNGNFEILTILAIDDGTPRYSAWINDEKVADEAPSAAAGALSSDSDSILGCRGDGGLFGQFDLAHFVSYSGNTMPLTEQEILDNIAYLNSEWDIYQSGITLSLTKKDGVTSLDDGTYVQHLYGDDMKGTNETELEVGQIANGEVTFTEELPENKVRFIRSVYTEEVNGVTHYVAHEQFFTD